MNDTSENIAQEQLRIAQQALAKGDLDDAEHAVSEVLRAYPNDPNASYTLAIVHRMRKNPSAAIETLDKLIAAHPDFARAYQEKGINLLMVSEPQTAGVALEKAVAVDPSLIESWKL